MVAADVTLDQAATSRIGRVAFGTATAALVAVALPVLWRGAPLGDDFNNCLAPLELGLAGFFAASWDRLGMVRPARFLEILLTTGVCRSLPFGVAILVPLLLTLAVALLVRSLLRDLDTPAPWPDIGGALWLLQPLGTEAALWPAALHVPLGLVLALVAVRLYRRGLFGWAALATLGAMLCVEQAILALPGCCVAHRTAAGAGRRAVVTAGAVAIVALLAFARWPGADPRLRVGLDRAHHRPSHRSHLLRRLSGRRAGPAFDPAGRLVGTALERVRVGVRGHAGRVGRAAAPVGPRRGRRGTPSEA